MKELVRSEIIPGHRDVCQLASRSDQEIFEAYEASQMQDSRLQVRYDRRPDYFAFESVQSDEPFSLGVLDGNDRLMGMGNLTARPGYIAGHLELIGYWCDLRMKSHRVASRAWRAYLRQYVEGCLRLDDPIRYHHCVVLKDNPRAARSLIKAVAPEVVAELLWDYSIKQVVARRPSLRRGTGSFIARRACRGDHDKLVDFFVNCHKGKLFGYDMALEFERRRASWHGFCYENFWLVEDKRGKILASCLPWSPGPSKRIIVESMSRGLELFCRGFNRLGPLTAMHLPMPGEEFAARYLTHLEFDPELLPKDRPGLFRILVNKIWGDLGGRHALLYFDDHYTQLTKGIRDYLVLDTPAAIYGFRHRSVPALKFEPHRGVGFEMAIH